MINKKKQYLGLLNQRRHQSKFNVIYQSLMGDLGIYKKIKSIPISDKKLNLILEQINKPQYIICESGKTILLEEAIYMTEQDLITEGILDTVTNKVKDLVDWIKQGIEKVIKESSQKIKAFCQKVRDNAIVKSIRKRLNLDQKLDFENFKKYFKVKNNKGKVIQQSVILLEAKSKKDDKDKKQNKKDKEQKACTIEIDDEGFKQKVKSVAEESTNQKELEEVSKQTATQIGGKKAQKILSESALTFGDEDKKQEQEENFEEQEINGKALLEGWQMLDDQEKKSLEDFKPGVTQLIDNVKSLPPKLKNKRKLTLVSNDDEQQSSDSDSNEKQNTQQKKKQGFFDRVGNKMKQKIMKGVQWFNKQNKLFKLLVYAIIAIIAIYVLIHLWSAFLVPLIYGILHGGVVNAVTSIVMIVTSTMTFTATAKSIKKAWQTGQGWGKAFLMIAMSILAIIALGNRAAQGKEMMKADQAAADELRGHDITQFSEKELSNIYSHPDKAYSLFKQNRLPGIDLNNPRYQDVEHGYGNFLEDLGKLKRQHNSSFDSQLFKDLFKKQFEKDMRSIDPQTSKLWYGDNKDKNYVFRNMLRRLAEKY